MGPFDAGAVRPGISLVPAPAWIFVRMGGIPMEQLGHRWVVRHATFPPQPRPLVSGLGTLGRAEPRAGPVFYLAFEAKAVEPPLIPLGVRKRISGYSLATARFSQAVTCFRPLGPGRFTFRRFCAVWLRELPLSRTLRGRFRFCRGEEKRVSGRGTSMT